MDKVTFTSLTKDELTQLVLATVIKAISLTSSHHSQDESYFNVTQTAEFLQLPVSTLYSYTSKRLIPHYKRGKRLVFKQSDLEAWLSESKKRTASEIEAEVYSAKSKKGDRK